jgi:hypothetical protein
MTWLSITGLVLVALALAALVLVKYQERHHQK